MKPRTVIVTLELVTDVPLRDLKNKATWYASVIDGYLEVRQVSAQVAQKATQ